MQNHPWLRDLVATIALLGRTHFNEGFWESYSEYLLNLESDPITIFFVLFPGKEPDLLIFG